MLIPGVRIVEVSSSVDELPSGQFLKGKDRDEFGVQGEHTDLKSLANLKDRDEGH